MANTCFTLPQVNEVWYVAVEEDFFDNYLITGDTIISQRGDITRLNCKDDFTQFTESQITDSTGVYYSNQLDFQYSDFNNGEVFTLNSKYTIFLKSNNVWYVAGYAAPLKLLKDENLINLSDNKQSVSLQGNTYHRVRKVKFNTNCSLAITATATTNSYPFYDSETTYNLGQQVNLNGKIYRSLHNANVDNLPTDSLGVDWEYKFDFVFSGSIKIYAGVSGYNAWKDSINYNSGQTALYDSTLWKSNYSGNLGQIPSKSSSAWYYLKDYKLQFSIDGINYSSQFIIPVSGPGTYTVYAKDISVVNCIKTKTVVVV